MCDRKKSFYEVGIAFLDLNLAISTLNSNFRQVNFLVYTHCKDDRFHVYAREAEIVPEVVLQNLLIQW